MLLKVVSCIKCEIKLTKRSHVPINYFVRQAFLSERV